MGPTRAAVCALLLVACDSSSKDGGAKATADVTGTLTIDGAAQVVVACHPKQQLGDTVLDLRIGRGTLQITDDDLYFHPTSQVIRGDRYACTEMVREVMSGGDSVTGKAFMHGRVRFACARGESKIAGDLTLACGELDEATRKQLEQGLQEARELVPGTGSPP